MLLPSPAPLLAQAWLMVMAPFVGTNLLMGISSQASEPPDASLRHRAPTREGFLGDHPLGRELVQARSATSERQRRGWEARGKDGWYFWKVRGSELNTFLLIALLAEAAFPESDPT